SRGMLILLRYGEIGLKSGPVKKKFRDRLLDRLREQLDYRGIDGDILRREGRIFADVAEEDAADAALALSQVPGVVSASPAVETTLVLDDIEAGAVELLADRNAETFAVDARRAGEHDYTSKDIEEAVGDAVREQCGLAVDLDDPDVTVDVEARYTAAYLYTETVDGIGGLPIGDENRVAVLFEDRAATVAAFLLMKRGCRVFPVYTGADSDAVSEEMEVLRQFDPGVKLTVMDGKTPAEALDDACDLFDCDAAALPWPSGELEQDVPATDVELLFPNAGFPEDEVMDRYAELLSPP
ncbi:MAG: THUMP domain-containing protein, partial [Candidatus Nanohaloarchaea archaeon]|nr:THUMP domain-containing protein [Candidatus Nanohaloarchaea archaeon]